MTITALFYLDVLDYSTLFLRVLLKKIVSRDFAFFNVVFYKKNYTVYQLVSINPYSPKFSLAILRLGVKQILINENFNPENNVFVWQWVSAVMFGKFLHLIFKSQTIYSIFAKIQFNLFSLWINSVTKHNAGAAPNRSRLPYQSLPQSSRPFHWKLFHFFKSAIYLQVSFEWI